MSPLRATLAAVFFATGVVLTTASSASPGSIDPCATEFGSEHAAAFPAPPELPRKYGASERSVPRPVLVAQDLSVAPGSTVTRIEPRAVVRTPCGVETVSRITFSNGRKFLIAPNVETVDPSPDAPLGSGQFIARFAR